MTLRHGLGVTDDGVKDHIPQSFDAIGCRFIFIFFFVLLYSLMLGFARTH